MYRTFQLISWAVAVVTLSLLGIMVPVRAETEAPEIPKLTVTGEGKFDVAPDKAVVSFAVETAGERLSDVQQENQTRMSKVFDEFRKLEIPSQFIQTTSFQVIPEYPPPPRRSSGESLEQSIPRILGYRVIHQVNVEVRDLRKVGLVVDRTLKVGANRFAGISWGLQQEEPVRLQALQQAADKASAKAETLARALHVKLVRIMQVTEGGVSIMAPRGQPRMMAMAMESSGDASISAGEISVHGTVTLVYEISQ
ncbi:MAG: SIMPL domain-containing protein [Nitrospira sp.]|nr:SIMPL domain-containing protein [Nitrospira sp.]MCA9476138.1 SIMPL domain-containing protein [Nitrospira sp.]MCA9481598.1 SIMPL domain-containing protein [Nitrospira sp.]MCB9711783.1 SIMPL domain-containing protein [Nitrospiraceae bacterium]